jgi:hypothetical protein
MSTPFTRFTSSPSQLPGSPCPPAKLPTAAVPACFRRCRARRGRKQGTRNLIARAGPAPLSRRGPRAPQSGSLGPALPSPPDIATDPATSANPGPPAPRRRQPRRGRKPITAPVKHLLRLRCKASPETGQHQTAPGREDLLYDFKGGSLRSPPALRLRAAASRPSSPRARTHGRATRRRSARHASKPCDVGGVAPPAPGCKPARFARGTGSAP